MKNFVTVAPLEFKDALKIFTRRGLQKGAALMCLEGNFLSIESGDRTAVMRAEGEWHGRATFRQGILQAELPPKFRLPRVT